MQILARLEGKITGNRKCEKQPRKCVKPAKSSRETAPQVREIVYPCYTLAIPLG